MSSKKKKIRSVELKPNALYLMFLGSTFHITDIKPEINKKKKTRKNNPRLCGISIGVRYKCMHAIRQTFLI